MVRFKFPSVFVVVSCAVVFLLTQYHADGACKTGGCKDVSGEGNFYTKLKDNLCRQFYSDSDLTKAALIKDCDTCEPGAFSAFCNDVDASKLCAKTGQQFWSALCDENTCTLLCPDRDSGLLQEAKCTSVSGTPSGPFDRRNCRALASGENLPPR